MAVFMAFPYAGDATMRARLAEKLKGIAVATDPLAPACSCRIVEIQAIIQARPPPGLGASMSGFPTVILGFRLPGVAVCFSRLLLYRCKLRHRYELVVSPGLGPARHVNCSKRVETLPRKESGPRRSAPDLGEGRP